MSNQEIIRSQSVPAIEVDYVQESLRPFPVFAVCPNQDCRANGPTKVTKACNFLNFLFCCLCANCWFLFNAWKRKENSCYDAQHHCLKCGKAIGNYEQC